MLIIVRMWIFSEKKPEFKRKKFSCCGNNCLFSNKTESVSRSEKCGKISDNNCLKFFNQALSIE